MARALAVHAHSWASRHCRNGASTVCIVANPCYEVERVRPALDARLRVLYGPKYRELGKEHASKRSPMRGQRGWIELGRDRAITRKRSFLAGDSSSIRTNTGYLENYNEHFACCDWVCKRLCEKEEMIQYLLTVTSLKRYYLNVIKNNKIIEMIICKDLKNIEV